MPVQTTRPVQTKTPVRTTRRRVMCRRAGVAASAILLLPALAGCHVKSDKESSNPATSSQATQAIPEENETTVKDAYIVPKFLPGTCTIQVGETADLRFLVTNNRHNQAERLLEVTTPAAESVLIAPGPSMDIPAGRGVAVGEPTSPDQPFTVTLQRVNETAKPGESVYVMFRFEDAGNVGLQVRVDGCPPPPAPPPPPPPAPNP